MTFSRTISACFYAISLYFLLFVSGVSATKRHINCKVLPDADNEALNLAYIIAVGDNDAIHYLWSTYKVPSAVVARTTVDAILDINFEKLKSMENGAFSFSEEPLAFTGLTISELFEKSYSSDTSSINKPASEMPLGLESFKWNNITNETFSCIELSASLHLESSSKEGEEFSGSGIFRMQFSASGEEEDAEDYPHLVYTGNSTQLKVAFDGFHSLLNSSRTRYGMEVVVFARESEKCSDVECKAVVEDSISDEFSPGVFSDVYLISPCTQKDNEKGSFLSWRPVAYTSKEPTVANSSDANISGNCPQASNGTARSIAELFFGDLAGITSNVFNMTFGTEGAGFYPKTEYSEWSFMLGTGVPAHSKLSVAAIVLLSVGVGGLGLSFLVGAVFLAVRFFRNSDDDLLLGENMIN